MVSAQAVEPRHHEHVAGAEMAEYAAELRAVALGAARGLPEHLAGAGGPELTHPGVRALSVGRDSA